MKRIVVLACLTVALVQHKADDNHIGQQGQKNASAAQSNTSASTPSRPTANTSEQHLSGDTDKNQDQNVKVLALPKVVTEKDRADWAIVVCTVLLTAVGIVGTCIAVRTLIHIKRQADTLDEHKAKFDDLAKAASSNAQAAILQVQAMQEQITQMAVQSGILQESVQVARDAAEAAKQNMEMFISKERARLRVEMKPLVLPSESNAPYDTVDFTVSAYGQTDAFVTESLCVAGGGPQEFINYPELWDRVMFPIHSLPSVVVADSAPRECSALIGKSGDSGDDLLIQEVKARRMFVCVRGFIKYKDVFDRERETAFRYVWRYSEAVADYGQWEKCGEPQENKET